MNIYYFGSLCGCSKTLLQNMLFVVVFTFQQGMGVRSLILLPQIEGLTSNLKGGFQLRDSPKDEGLTSH